MRQHPIALQYVEEALEYNIVYTFLVQDKKSVRIEETKPQVGLGPTT